MVVFEWQRQLHQLAHFFGPGVVQRQFIVGLGSIALALEINSVPSDEHGVLVPCPWSVNETTLED